MVYESEIVTADPGLTDATFRLVHIEVILSTTCCQAHYQAPRASRSTANYLLIIFQIDGSAPENQNPKQHLEGSEFITVLRMPVHGLLEVLRGTGSA